ncbi:hypothetical protein [Neorhizobium galegae]|uniref:hypothetical protein n=1 Tax=Neorhizobium galegae TaxID=399 RepID=UPI001F45E707|nr:hypothetical protein [Neorhizobium galegae]UIK08647.1 hypothetical protein LZK81_24455 [Neorhizobium galegae]UIY31363.1 hypothetical protein LZK73_29965 [Neorhizobium galegae]
MVPSLGLRNAASHLHPVSQKEVSAFLREIAAETGLATLLVTRDRDIAETISTRVIDLGGREGKTV